MEYFISMLVGLVIGFAAGLILTSCLYDAKIAIKLSNMMNASMLDCVTHKVIAQEQVHDIEDVFFKHVEANFKGIKAGHCNKRWFCSFIGTNYNETWWLYKAVARSEV